MGSEMCIRDRFITQYFQGVDTICTIHYAVFSGGGYYLYYALRSIFKGRIQFLLSITQYFQGVDTTITMHYAVFSGDRYCEYYALRSIVKGVDTICTELN